MSCLLSFSPQVWLESGGSGVRICGVSCCTTSRAGRKIRLEEGKRRKHTVGHLVISAYLLLGCPKQTEKEKGSHGLWPKQNKPRQEEGKRHSRLVVGFRSLQQFLYNLILPNLDCRLAAIHSPIPTPTLARQAHATRGSNVSGSRS